MRRLAATALLALFAAAPALAQTTPAEEATRNGAGIPAAPGLPGVGLTAAPDSGADSAEGRPQGAGGLQNGVGGEGTLAPSTTGSNDGLVDTQPAEEDAGVPLDPVVPKVGG